MSAVGITENAKGDNKKFEIWCNSREEVYIVQVWKHRKMNHVIIFCIFLIVSRYNEMTEDIFFVFFNTFVGKNTK